MTGSRLERLLESERFAVTGEIAERRSAEGESIAASARRQLGYVDALNVGDNPLGRAHISPVAAASFVAAAGVEPIMQLTVRDRNRLAITSDLLGGWAVGARNLLLLSGDPMSLGEEPGAKEVRDIGVPEAVRMASELREEGRTSGGGDIEEPPRFFVGVADNPLIAGYEVSRLEVKLDAGARFVQTQIVYDVEALAAWAETVRRNGMFERASILVGTAPLRSLRNARWMNDKLPGVSVPDRMLHALEEAGPDEEENVGVGITVEVLNGIREIKGIAGVHVMALGKEEPVRRVVDGAGMFPRPVLA